METSLVALITGNDRREMVREALTVLGEEFNNQAKNAKRVFVHPNLVNFKKQAASTHVEAVRGVIDHISLHRGDEILVGDAGFHSTKKAFEAFDYESLKRSGNVRLVDLNDDKTVPAFAYATDMKKRDIGFSKTVAESDLNIVVVPPKMHSYYIASLSLKTHIIGSLVVERTPFGIYARWPWIHTGYRQAHQTLAELYALHPAQLTIIDGTQAMEGNGPTSGTTVNLGWVVASCNPVAADALAAYLMGLHPEDIGYLWLLNEAGFGPIHLDSIKVIGPNPKPLRRELARPDSYPSILEWRNVTSSAPLPFSHRLRHALQRYMHF